MIRLLNRKLLLLSTLTLFIGMLFGIDRIYFKRNHSFNIRFLYSSLPTNPEWDLPSPSQEESASLDKILDQKFHYLAKGCHCYAFISENGNYVIKFHRYASHMRQFPWLNHPFAYHFDEARKKIKEHNFSRLHENFLSYKKSYEDLLEETGILLLHINRTDYLHKSVTLVDATQAQYQVPLDQVTFILQHKADLIYPTLDRLTKEQKTEEAKKVVSQIVDLIATCCKKGYVDKDPVLYRNYGLLESRAIHIDVGDLVQDESIKSEEANSCLRPRNHKKLAQTSRNSLSRASKSITTKRSIL